MTARATLPEPVEIAKFWKNRKGEAIIVTLKDFNGRAILDVRTHFTTKDGKLQPTSKGLAIMVLRLPELAKAISKALARARELNLIDDPDEAEL
jgi:hypothetical protein